MRMIIIGTLLLLHSGPTLAQTSEEVEEVIEAVESVSTIDQALQGPVALFCTTSLHKSQDKSELGKTRTLSPFMEKCLKAAKVKSPTSFEESIKLTISQMMQESGNKIDSYVSKLYGVEKWEANVGLISHPMCEKTDKKLYSGSTTKKQTRLNSVATELNKIPKEFNRLRAIYLKSIKDKKPKAEIEKNKVTLMKFYYHLMAVLAQHESLSSADTATSKRRAKEFGKHYGLTNYKKNEGVKFYYDSNQSKPDSKRNIGLYQFSADPKGNISPCIKAWNDSYGKKSNDCKISNSSKKSTFQLLGASDQVFNAFCGVHKLVQSFGIQVNSSKFDVGSRRRTHSSNLDQNKKLKKPSQRCVSLFTDSRNTYNHYGTLGFTTSNNTKNVIKSVNKLLFPN